MFNTVFHKNKINVRLGILLNICSPSIRNNRKEKKNHVLLVLLWSIVKCFALNSVLYSSRTCLAIFLPYCNLPEP